MTARLKRDVPRLALTRAEAADALGMSVDHFDRHVRGELRAVYVGSLTLYPVAELQRWLQEQGTPAGRKRVA